MGFMYRQKKELNEPRMTVTSVWCVFLFLIDIDTDAIESYVAEETIEFLVNVEESVVDDE